MTLRERILAVYRGETPDVVPYMLDLSHWFYHRHHLAWDLSQSYEEPEFALIDYHKRAGAGFYMPNLGSFYAVDYSEEVQAECRKDTGGPAPAITWRLTTPLGTIARTRLWEEGSYSWAIREWPVRGEPDLRVLAYALSRRTYTPLWDRWQAWRDYVGDTGVVYLSAGYSAMGQLLNYWMGVTGVAYAAADYPAAMHSVVEQINENNLQLIDLLASSPAEIIEIGDNFSSDVQPPRFFAQWSRDFYTEAFRRLHAAGKYVSVHLDGRLRGALGMFREIGADCADAVTPTPTGDLTARECREEAGPELILSGGVAPALWLPRVEAAVFRTAVRDWLDLKRSSQRLIAAAGDQVPPGAPEDRIALMRELVEEYGRF